MFWFTTCIQGFWFSGLMQESSWQRSLHRRDLRLEVCSQTLDKISLPAWLTPGYSASLLFYFSSQWQISVSLKDTHIFLLDGALFTVVCIRDSWSSTDDTAALVGAIVTLITDAHQGARPHIGITDHTFAITWGEKQIRLSSWPATTLYRVTGNPNP